MIVLDTHVWLWWISDPDELSGKARATLDQAAAGEGIFISSISAWEVVLLVARGRLDLSLGVQDWVARSESLPFITFVPVDNNIALRSTDLPGYDHPDPADRIIVATAISLGKTLVTKDKRIRNYAGVETVW